MTVIAAGDYDDSRRLLLTSLDGAATLAFGDPYAFLLPGVTGHRMPPRTVVTQKIAGMDGSWRRQVQIGEREVFLPVVIYSDSHVDQLDAVSQLEALLTPPGADDDLTQDGSLLLVATSANGRRLLPVTYTQGLEGDEGTGAGGALWNIFGIKLLAVAPYWQDTVEQHVQRTVSVGAPFLSTSTAYPWPRSLSQAQILGQTMTVDVQSDVPVWPVVEAVGPFGNTAFTASSGMDIAMPSGIPAGKGLRIVTDPRRRAATLYDVNSSDQWTNPQQGWSLIDVAPTFAPLQPAGQGVAMVASSATAATRLRLGWVNLYRSAW